MRKYNIYSSHNTKRCRNFIFFGCFIIGIALFLGVLMPFGAKKYPVLMAFGFIAFAIAAVLSGLCGLYVGLRTDRYVQKHHFSLWEKWKNGSRKERNEAARLISSLEDPYLKRVSAKWNKIGLLCFLIWLILFLSTSSVVIILDMVSK